MSPNRVTHLGGFYLAPGYSTEFLQFFLAQDLTHSPLEQDEDEDIRLNRLTIPEVKDWIEKGQVYDSKTLAGLLIGFQYLRLLNWTL